MSMTESTNSKHDHKIMETFKDIIPLSFGEEIGNSVSHGLAVNNVMYFTLCCCALLFTW